MVTIVTVCVAFGLTASEANTELMRLGARGMGDVTATFSVETANLGGNVNYDAGLSIEVDRRIRPTERSPGGVDPYV